MTVPNVLGGLANLTSRTPGAISAANKASTGKAAAPAQSSPPTPTAAMRDVLSHYDMTDISPNDFSKVIQQLSQKGAISPKDMQELSSIRGDLENAGINADESVNLVQFYQQRLATAQTAAGSSPNPASAKPAIDALAARLNWVQRFAAVGQPGGQGGVNAVA